MNLRLTLLLFTFCLYSHQELISKSDGCFLRCVAQCVAKKGNAQDHQTLESCEPQCLELKNERLCSNSTCWSTCDGKLSPEQTLPAPTNLTAHTNSRELSWNAVSGAVMYYVGYRPSNTNKFASGDFLVTVQNFIDISSLRNVDQCSEMELAVVAFSEKGVGTESKELKMGRPSPTADPKLELLQMQYLNTTLVSDFYQANATVHVEFRYSTDPWFLGQDDLEVQPLFHLISCGNPDLSQGIPVPEFTVHKLNRTISTLIGSDMMERQCRYVYFLQSVSSKQCGTITEIPSPPPEALQTVQIECDIVKDAPCFKVPIYPHPQCGQVGDVEVNVVSRDRENLNDPSANLEVNVTFKASTWGDDIPTLYYVGIYGEAVEYKTKDEEAFLGVNITHVLGQRSSCQKFDDSGNCLKENTNRSIMIPGLHPEKLYGLTICAVKDIRNVTLPDLSATLKSSRPKAVKILLVEDQRNTSQLVPYQILIQSDINFRLLDYTDNTHEVHVPERNRRNVSEEPRLDKPTNISVLSLYSDTNNTSEDGEKGGAATSHNRVNVSNDRCENLFNNITSDVADECLNFTTPSSPISSTIPTASQSTSVGWIVGTVIGGTVILLAVLFGCCCYYRRDRRRQMKKYKLEIAQMEKDRNRYTDLPVVAKNDIWEIERRNLVIYNDKKLGSGAFGAVYLGKLIGKSLAHRDANSPLGINMMRAENCQVAVKMLPEYADEMSKHEFLREIALMKTLGYHERLVNMLACVTESEPLCLIVEFCDDGDLLQYLRERCKYMMKLDDLSISYHDPPENENYDPNMIITLKQLLQFAVQISYGLEFLSQRGFIHRDVAARNVLVHEGTSCKIGDFGLCRYIYADQSQYKSKGGKLPLKWMSPEAIRHYEFSIKSDVWSFGVLLFEIITLGGSPYPGMPPEDVLPFLESGGRIEKPDNCPDNFYGVMEKCWCSEPDERIEFSDVRMQLATQLEDITEDYSYLKLDAAKDYYNVQYGDEKNEASCKIQEVSDSSRDAKEYMEDTLTTNN